MTPDPALPDHSSLLLPVDIRRLPWIRRLAADYAYDFGPLAPFFAGDPTAPASWSAAIARTRGHVRDPARTAAVVSAQQAQRDAPAAARASAALLAQPGTVAIVTGQQAGLFGGPLYTLLKAVTTIQLAERVTRDHGVRAVPVFWVESEDHDWDEVASCAVLDADMQRRSIALGAPRGAGEEPVASIRLDPSVFAAIEVLRSSMPETEFTADLVRVLSEAYAPGRGMSEAFCRWMESVLGPHGLVVYDSADPAAKPLVGGVFARELESPTETTRLARDAGDALVAAGYHAQVVPHADNVALFRLDGTRQTIHFRDGRFLVGDRPVECADLVSAASQQPEGFSPNVLLRPVVEDTLFPTVCYVAGPNELAYLAQLKPIYERFGIAAPLMYPRGQATLLDSAAARFLGRYKVAFETLQLDNETALNRLLETHLPGDVEAAYEDAVQAVGVSMGRLVGALPALDPTLENAARSSLGRMQHDLRSLHDKIIHAAKRRNDTLRRQFARTRALAFPDGHPQERAVGSVYFLNRYGPALVTELRARLPLDLGMHWLLAL